MSYLTYLAERFKEPSSWIHIIKLAAAFSIITLTPDQQTAITDLIVLLSASTLAGVVTPDRRA